MAEALKLTTAGRILPADFFARDAQALARALIGMVIRHRVGDLWLAARIVETEALNRPAIPRRL